MSANLTSFARQSLCILPEKNRNVSSSKSGEALSSRLVHLTRKESKAVFMSANLTSRLHLLDKYSSQHVHIHTQRIFSPRSKSHTMLETDLRRRPVVIIRTIIIRRTTPGFSLFLADGYRNELASKPGCHCAARFYVVFDHHFGGRGAGAAAGH